MICLQVGNRGPDDILSFADLEDSDLVLSECPRSKQNKKDVFILTKAEEEEPILERARRMMH